jgi:hypothetical protein
MSVCAKRRQETPAPPNRLGLGYRAWASRSAGMYGCFAWMFASGGVPVWGSLDDFGRGRSSHFYGVGGLGKETVCAV